MELHMTDVTTNPQTPAKVKFQANLDDKGRMAMEVIIKPLSVPLDMETTFSLNDYALEVLTPYVGKYTGRELKDGKLDLKMDYRIGGNKLTASHKLLIQRFEFGHSDRKQRRIAFAFWLSGGPAGRPSGKNQYCFACVR